MNCSNQGIFFSHRTVIPFFLLLLFGLFISGIIISNVSGADSRNMPSNNLSESWQPDLKRSVNSYQYTDLTWQKCLGGDLDDDANNIQQTSDGGYIVAATTSSTDGDVIGKTKRDCDIWVIKLTYKGSISWQKCLGGSKEDGAYYIQQTSDGGYIVCGYTASTDGDVTRRPGDTSITDAWVVKLTSSGTISWQKCLGGSKSDLANSIQQTRDGGYVIAGRTNSDDGNVTGLHGSGSLYDYWVVKITSTGDISWQKCLGGSNGDEANSIQQTDDNGYIVSGFTHSIDGNVTGSHGESNYDMWVVKLTDTGNVSWERCLGGTDNDIAHSILQISSGRYVVAGQTASTDGDMNGTHGSSDAWVAELTENGNISWQKCLGGSKDDGASCIRKTSDGGYIVGGYSASGNHDVTVNNGKDDVWVVKLANNGNISWQKSLGGTENERAFSTLQTSDGGYLVGGYTSSSNGDVKSHHDYEDAWIVKLHLPPPEVASINPVSATNTQTLKSMLITGANFTNGVEVYMYNSSIRIPGTISFVNKNTLSCTFPLTGAPQWRYDLIVTNPDGGSYILPDAFTITNSTPSITALNPSSSFNTSNTNVSITGTGFRNGISVSLVNGTTILPGLIINRSISHILCQFDVLNQTPGFYNLTVHNIDGSTCSKTNAFQVKGSGYYPEIINVSPRSGVNTAALVVIFNGTNFRPGIRVIITNGVVSKTLTPISITSTQIRCSLPLTGFSTGLYDLSVMNTDGTIDTVDDAFEVTNPVPTISSLTPNSGYNTSIIQIAINGARFVTGCKASLINENTTIPGVISGFSSIKCTGIFNLTGAPAGIYNLTITNPVNLSVTRPFTIKFPDSDPIISNFSPEYGVNTRPLSVTIYGSNFRTGATVTITNGSITKTVSGTVFAKTKIICTLPLTSLPAGLYDVSVRNLDGSNTTNYGVFQVMNPVPSITSITPSSAFNTGPAGVTITGANFVSNCTISLKNESTFILGVISEFSPSKLTGIIDIHGVPAGRYNLLVINPGGQNKTKIFTVKDPEVYPIISTFTPLSGVNNATLPLTIIGNYFRSGLIVTLSNGSIQRTVTGMVSGAKKITCSIPLTGLQRGSYNISVRNSDGSNTSSPVSFQVTNPVPTVLRVSPGSGYNTGPVTLTISGTNFVSETSITLTNNSTSINGEITSQSKTTLVGSFPINGANPGIYNLTASNQGMTEVIRPNVFTILTPGNKPVFISMNPVSGFNNAKLPVTISGSNLKTPKIFFSQDSFTIPASPTTGKTSSATTQYITLSLNGVPGGLYNLTICNSDGLNTTVNNIFYVTDERWLRAGKKTVDKSPVIKGEKPTGGRLVSGSIPITRPIGRSFLKS